MVTNYNNSVSLLIHIINEIPYEADNIHICTDTCYPACHEDTFFKITYKETSNSGKCVEFDIEIRPSKIVDNLVIIGHKFIDKVTKKETEYVVREYETGAILTDVDYFMKVISNDNMWAMRTTEEWKA
jgi:hypothetical protein